MSLKLFIVPAVVLTLAYGLIWASAAHADVHTVEAYSGESSCALVEGMVECDVSHISGISRIEVTVDSGIGPITIFDEEYEDCPTEVQITLDPIVIDETSSMKITPCQPPFSGEVIVCIADECPANSGVIVCILNVDCPKPEVSVGLPDPFPLKSPDSREGAQRAALPIATRR